MDLEMRLEKHSLRTTDLEELTIKYLTNFLNLKQKKLCYHLKKT